ncbi:MAG: HEAT repeat domain-containing protein [Gemmatimonadota bacterium]
MTGLQIILIASAAMFGIGVIGIITWLAYSAWLSRLERRLEARKGVYRDLVTGLATRERALLEPELHQGRTLRDFEALEAVLEEQARGVTERPAWLLDAYDRLGLVDKYVEKLRTARQWRERAFAAELLGRVGNAKAVPVLLETVQATRTEDADVREIALRALARIADPRAVPPLVEALRQAEVWLAPRIADILVRHGQLVIDPMIGFLEETARHPARAWAANILGEMKAARAFPALARALSDLDDEVRAKAAGALGRLGDHRAISYLLDHLLTDPAPFVRARIAGALGQFGDSEVIDHLVRALGDPAWWVRMRSVEALEQIGPVAEQPLLLALADPDPEIRVRAAVALERLGVPARLVDTFAAGKGTAESQELMARFAAAGAREFLAEQLHHPSADVRRAVLTAIRSTGRRDLPTELIETAGTDADGQVRTMALEILRQFGAREAVPVALDRLADPVDAVRTAATELLGDLGDAGLAETLRPRTGDSEASVRAAAARALGYIKADGVDAEIQRLLRDPEPSVRMAAAQGAAAGGWRGTEAPLLQLLGDSTAAVRLAAARALGSVGTAESLPVLIRTFRDAPPDLRQAIIDAVAHIKLEELNSLLDILLERNDIASRLTTVETISRIAGPASLGLLAKLWRDPAPEVRGAAAAALAERGDEAGALLDAGLTDPEEAVRAATIDGLVRMGRSTVGPALLTLVIEDPSDLVRERAALAIGLFRLSGGEVALLRACRTDERLTVRAAAILGLGAFDQESMVAQVIQMADEKALRELLASRLAEDLEYQRLAERLREARHVELRALGAVSRQEMEGILAEGMRGALDPDARIRLVSGLRAFQGDRSRTALLQVLRSDPSPQVRAAALAAVGSMLDTEELLLTAGRALGDPQSSVRRTAVTLLARIAPERSLPLLIRALRADDEVPTLQAIAAQAESAFPIFLDLLLGLAIDGEEAVLITRVARYIHHPDLRRLLPAFARDKSAPVREALAALWAARPDLNDDTALSALATDPAVPVRRAALRAWLAAGRLDAAERMAADPDPELRTDLALGLKGHGKVSDALSLDPDERVRSAVWVARLLNGVLSEIPADGAITRANAAAAIRRETDSLALRRIAEQETDIQKRRAAVLALAVLGDPLAGELATRDPDQPIRAAVVRILAWDGTP